MNLLSINSLPVRVDTSQIFFSFYFKVQENNVANYNLINSSRKKKFPKLSDDGVLYLCIPCLNERKPIFECYLYILKSRSGRFKEHINDVHEYIVDGRQIEFKNILDLPQQFYTSSLDKKQKVISDYHSKLLKLLVVKALPVNFYECAEAHDVLLNAPPGLTYLPDARMIKSLAKKEIISQARSFIDLYEKNQLLYGVRFVSVQHDVVTKNGVNFVGGAVTFVDVSTPNVWKLVTYPLNISIVEAADFIQELDGASGKKGIDMARVLEKELKEIKLCARDIATIVGDNEPASKKASEEFLKFDTELDIEKVMEKIFGCISHLLNLVSRYTLGMTSRTMSSRIPQTVDDAINLLNVIHRISVEANDPVKRKFLVSVAGSLRLNLSESILANETRWGSKRKEVIGFINNIIIYIHSSLFPELNENFDIIVVHEIVAILDEVEVFSELSQTQEKSITPWVGVLLGGFLRRFVI